MEIDNNLNKMANFFKFFLRILEKLQKKKVCIVFLHWGNEMIFSSRCSNNNFMLEKRFYVKYLSSFDQNTAKSP